MWHAAALVGLFFLIRRKPSGAGNMSHYFKAAGKCLYKPDGAPSYEIPCADWELEKASEEREFLEGGL